MVFFDLVLQKLVFRPVVISDTKDAQNTRKHYQKDEVEKNKFFDVIYDIFYHDDKFCKTLKDPKEKKGFY